MTSFSQATIAINEITQRIKANNGRMATAQQSTSTSVADLTAMETAYGQIVADIDTMLATTPSDPAIQNLKASKDLLVTEFLAALTRATSMDNAIKSI